MIDLDRVRGALYGQAIGDALGIPIEFKSRGFIEKRFGKDGYPKDYEASRGFEAGEWSDDTAQAICILDAYRADGDLVPQTIAGNFQKWAQTDGRGMGNLTQKVFLDGLYAMEPHRVAEAVWEESGQKAAPNGAVMRTAYVGLLRPWDLDYTEEAAVLAARCSHFDPRCVASAVAVSVAVAMLCQGESGAATYSEAGRRAAKYHKEVWNWISRELSDLWLDEGLEIPRTERTKRPPIGYTYKTLGAGFYALNMAIHRPHASFMHNLGEVLNAGGDTDTNAAVAGALLGAFYGFYGISRDLSDGTIPEGRLDELFDALIATYPDGHC